jgi:transposase, IS5 family
MIRDRYDPVQLFDLVPQLQLQFEPELAELDRLLDDAVLFQQVKNDLAQRCPKSRVTGRLSTPVEVILRMLIVKHLYQWSYEATEHFVGDSLVLRQFCRLGLEQAPDDTTLLRWANQIQPQTLHQLLDRVTDLARQQKVTRGRKLRTDSTVVETAIHHPSDSTLLADGVRVVSRLLRQARTLVPEGAPVNPQVFRDRTRSARRLSRKIGERAVRGTPKDEEDPRIPLYRRLLMVARASRRQAQQIRHVLATVDGKRAERVRSQLDRFQSLATRVIGQTERRVLQGQKVPAAEKVLSLFEPHTALIRRGKLRQPTEFGRKVLLDEVEGGLITRYAVLSGNPPDAAQFPTSLDHHQARFARAPDLVAADRSFWSPDNEQAATAQGVRRVAIPRRGGRTPSQERERWFRRGHRFRTGIEGRISVLRRRFGLARCRYHGHDGMERWVGFGILAHNLRTIGHHLAQQRAA